VEAIRPAIEAKQHGITLDVEPAPMWVDGDRARLVQVISNLLHNAAKFTPSGGHVVLSLVRAGDTAQIGVRDNGPGIKPSDLAYVFRLFAQGGADMASREHGGLGVGLSLVHQLVTDHGGQVSAFSSGQPGQGAEFVVTLPLILAPEVTADQRAKGGQPLP
ncbi:MAG: ATP-binding protein, partial [Thermomonas sp.]